MNSTRDESLAKQLSPSAKDLPGTFTPATRSLPIVTPTSIERSWKGEWRQVPAININGTTIAVRGTKLKIAYVHDEEWLRTGLGDPIACIQAMKEQKANRLDADIFTFGHQLPAASSKYPYHSELESLAVIHVQSFDDWWEKLPQATRKNVRRSQKRDVRVEVKPFDDRLVEDIVKLTNDSPIRQGKRFHHYGKSFEQVKKDQATHVDHSDFVCAYSGDDLIGLLKLVYGANTASVLQFFPKASEQDKRPANALIAKGVELCEAKGIPYFIYGKLSYGNKRHSTLLDFKVRNGFEETLVPRFYVPLTVKGAVCIKLGLHRGLLGLVPDMMIRAGVRLRSKWYDLRDSSKPV